MKSDDLLLVELICFIISLGYLLIYLTKGNNLAERKSDSRIVK